MATTGAVSARAICAKALGNRASEGEGYSPGSDVTACLRRVRHWRVPPNWTVCEWMQELAAQGEMAAYEACSEYDAARGVTPAYFVICRVRGRLLARYRQEWNFALRMACWSIDSQEAAMACSTATAKAAHREIRQNLFAAIERLREIDRWLVVQIFWHDRDQAELARELGISQPAVSKRYRNIVRQLRCILSNR
jgi:RNA polymerase sigma factor (sigma-70 family)